MPYCILLRQNQDYVELALSKFRFWEHWHVFLLNFESNIQYKCIPSYIKYIIETKYLFRSTFLKKIYRFSWCKTKTLSILKLTQNRCKRSLILINSIIYCYSLDIESKFSEILGDRVLSLYQTISFNLFWIYFTLCCRSIFCRINQDLQDKVA